MGSNEQVFWPQELVAPVQARAGPQSAVAVATEQDLAEQTPVVVLQVLPVPQSALLVQPQVPATLPVSQAPPVVQPCPAALSE